LNNLITACFEKWEFEDINKEIAIPILAAICLYRIDFGIHMKEQSNHNFTNSEKVAEAYLLENLSENNFLYYVKAHKDSISHFFVTLNYLSFSEPQKDRLPRSTSYSDKGSISALLKISYDHEFHEDWIIWKANWKFLNESIQLFDQGDELIVANNQESGSYSLLMKGKDDSVTNIADLGTGSHRLINLIFSLLNINGTPDFDRNYFDPRILHVEEPEANLHPAFASKLADLFVNAAKSFNTQFIIETHSEYLIRKLQYLTAKKEIKPEDTVIYYFYPPDHPDVVSGREPQVKKINILSDGRLSAPFGEGFFDESARLMIDLMNLNAN